MVVGLLYLRRIQARLPCMVLTSRTLQRLFLVAVMTASKFLEDIPLSNEGWAEIGGITLAEVNALEIDFLFGIEFKLRVTSEEYARLAEELRYPACAHLDAEARQSPRRVARPMVELEATSRRPRRPSRAASGRSRPGRRQAEGSACRASWAVSAGGWASFFKYI